MITIVILAAGQGSRMRGGDKLLEDVDGSPCLTVLTRRALATGFCVSVVVPDMEHPRARAAPDARLIPAPDAKLGMAHSIRAGLADLSDETEAIIILPGDMPEVTTEDLIAVAKAYENSGKGIVQMGTQDGKPGHPVLFARRYFLKLSKLSGDRGAAPVIAAHRDDWHLLHRDGQRARRDLDTPEDWATWRANRTPQG